MSAVCPVPLDKTSVSSPTRSESSQRRYDFFRSASTAPPNERLLGRSNSTWGIPITAIHQDCVAWGIPPSPKDNSGDLSDTRTPAFSRPSCVVFSWWFAANNFPHFARRVGDRVMPGARLVLTYHRNLVRAVEEKDEG